MARVKSKFLGAKIRSFEFVTSYTVCVPASASRQPFVFQIRADKRACWTSGPCTVCFLCFFSKAEGISGLLFLQSAASLVSQCHTKPPLSSCVLLRGEHSPLRPRQWLTSFPPVRAGCINHIFKLDQKFKKHKRDVWIFSCIIEKLLMFKSHPL